jgi:hypothetical protein
MGWGRSWWLVGNWAVDSQHGTGVEGSLHACTKGYHPSKGFFRTYKSTHKLLCIVGDGSIDLRVN